MKYILLESAGCANGHYVPTMSLFPRAAFEMQQLLFRVHAFTQDLWQHRRIECCAERGCLRESHATAMAEWARIGVTPSWESDVCEQQDIGNPIVYLPSHYLIGS
jgi:hypothetical protein